MFLEKVLARFQQLARPLLGEETEALLQSGAMQPQPVEIAGQT